MPSKHVDSGTEDAPLRSRRFAYLEALRNSRTIALCRLWSICAAGSLVYGIGAGFVVTAGPSVYSSFVLNAVLWVPTVTVLTVVFGTMGSLMLQDSQRRQRDEVGSIQSSLRRPPVVGYGDQVLAAAAFFVVSLTSTVVYLLKG
jgi:hypothetical protein